MAQALANEQSLAKAPIELIVRGYRGVQESDLDGTVAGHDDMGHEREVCQGPC